MKMISTKLSVFKTTDYLGTHDPFDYVEAPTWGEFRYPNQLNLSTVIPTRYDVDLTKIPYSYFKSGIGDGKDLEFERFVDCHSSVAVITRSGEVDCNPVASEGPIYQSWRPSINYGEYYVYQNRGYLYPDEKIQLFQEDVTREGFGSINPNSKPSLSIPLNVTQYGYVEGSILPKISFSEIDAFTGRPERTGRLVVVTPEDSDPLRYEFIVTNNEYEYTKLLPASSSAPYIYFDIEVGPNLNMYTFSRLDIFINEMTYLNWELGKKNGTLSQGDYFVGALNSPGPIGIIGLYSLTDKDDYGIIDFKSGTPISVTLNRDYRETLVEEVGTSIGLEREEFHTEYVPVIDNSSFKVYVTGVEWTQVDDIYVKFNDIYVYADTDKIYEFDYDKGIVRFGSGVSGNNNPGLIPPANSIISVAYSTSPLLEMAPLGTDNEFTDKTLEISPVTSHIDRGYLYLSNYDLVPSQIELVPGSLTFNDDNGAYGPAFIGSSIAFKATVLTSKNEPVPNQVVIINDLDNVGDFTNNYKLTNADGEVIINFDIGKSIENFAYKSNFYKELTQQYYFSNQGEDPSLSYDFRNPNLPIRLFTFDSLTPAGKLSSSRWTDSNSLVLNGVLKSVTGREDELVLFAVYNDNSAVPYNPYTGTGGRLNIMRDSFDDLLEVNTVETYSNYSILNFKSPIPSKYRIDVDNSIPIHGFNDCIILKHRAIYSTELLVYVASGPISGYISVGDTMELTKPVSCPCKGYYKILEMESVSAPNVPFIAGYTCWARIRADREIYSTGVPFSDAYWTEQFEADFYEPDHHLVGFVVGFDTEGKFTAEVACTKPLVKSSIVPVTIALPDTYFGVFTIGDPTAYYGATVRGFNYFRLDSMSITGWMDNGTISTSTMVVPVIGKTITIIGQNFPTDRIPSIWVGTRKLENDKIVMNSSTSITIDIPSMTIVGSQHVLITVGVLGSTEATWSLEYLT